MNKKKHQFLNKKSLKNSTELLYGRPCLTFHEMCYILTFHEMCYIEAP